MRQKEIEEKRREEERDRWFNQARLMTKARQTWREKRRAREENTSDSGDSLNEYEGKKWFADKACDEAAGQSKEHTVDVNMVFMIPTRFCAPEVDVAKLALGAEGTVFEKLGKTDEHVKSLLIRWAYRENIWSA
jgi:hypothetical protein